MQQKARNCFGSIPHCCCIDVVDGDWGVPAGIAGLSEVIEGRWRSLDLLRFVAAFGIVWAHMLNPNPIATIGYTALALFLILVPFLSIHHIDRKDRPASRKRSLMRMKRILVPWLFWSLFFKLLMAVQARDPLDFFVVHDPKWLLIGPTIHLWFLPFIFVVTAVFVPLSRHIDTVWRLRTACVGAFALGLVCMYLHDYAGLAEPWGQWLYALPPYLYGLLAAYGAKLRSSSAPIVFLVALALIFWIAGDSYWPPHFIAALVLFELAFVIRLESQIWSVLGSLAFGIYLMHPFWMLVWYYAAAPGSSQIVGTVAVFLASAGSTLVLRNMPYLRSIV